MFWKIVLIPGVLLGLLVTGFAVALMIANGPGTSWEDATLGVIPVAFVLSIFFCFPVGADFRS